MAEPLELSVFLSIPLAEAVGILSDLMPAGGGGADAATVTSAILPEEEGCAVKVGAEALPSAAVPDVFVDGALADWEKRDASPCRGDKGGFPDIGACSTFGEAEAAEWAFGVPAMPAAFNPFKLTEGVPAEAAGELLSPSVRGALVVEGRERPKRIAEISMEAVLSLGLLESSIFFSGSAVALPASSFIVERFPSSTGFSR